VAGFFDVVKGWQDAGKDICLIFFLIHVKAVLRRICENARQRANSVE
jgi:hypothetical protein